jgi:2-haloacid dehalogenase
MIKGIVFDVYGTLFDLGSIADGVRGFTADPQGFCSLWRSKQLEYTFLRSLMGRHADFWTVTEDALDFALGSYAITLPGYEKEKLMGAYLTLSPFPEVVDVVRYLGGYALAVLSNGSPKMLGSLLANSGILMRLRHLISAEEVRTYKPSPLVYALAPKHLGIPKEDILFVSSNAFDVAGGKSYGFNTCWVNRTGSPFDELGVEPDAVVKNLEEMVVKLNL